VVDAIEARFDITFDDVLVVGGWLREVVDLGDGILSSSSWPKPVTGCDEIGFEDGLQDELQGHLHDTVADGGNTQIPQFASCLWDRVLANRTRTKRPCSECLTDFLQQEFDASTSSLNAVPGLAIYTGRT